MLVASCLISEPAAWRLKLRDSTTLDPVQPAICSDAKSHVFAKVFGQKLQSKIDSLSAQLEQVRGVNKYLEDENERLKTNRVNLVGKTEIMEVLVTDAFQEAAQEAPDYGSFVQVLIDGDNFSVSIRCNGPDALEHIEAD